MLRRAQYLLIALFVMWVIALICPRAGLATTVTDNITVANPSFEQNVAPLTDSDTHGSWNYYIYGWTISPANSGGTWLSNGTAFNSPTLPDGSYVAWSNGGTISQTLSDTLQTGTYTLTVYVGHRINEYPSSTGPFDPPFYIALYAGSTLLTYQTQNVTSGNWLKISQSYTPEPGDPFGVPLDIVLYSKGDQVDFDKVSLTRTHEVVPVPASALLLGSGLAGLGLLRFRRKKVS